jgi:hypothetical protein
MSRQLDSRRRVIPAISMVVLAVLTSVYALFVSITEDVGSALVPILSALIFSFNCLLFLSGRAFPSRDYGRSGSGRRAKL